VLLAQQVRQQHQQAQHPCLPSYPPERLAQPGQQAFQALLLQQQQAQQMLLGLSLQLQQVRLAFQARLAVAALPA
jgi:hypothetical protein